MGVELIMENGKPFIIRNDGIKRPLYEELPEKLPKKKRLEDKINRGDLKK